MSGAPMFRDDSAWDKLQALFTFDIENKTKRQLIYWMTVTQVTKATKILINVLILPLILNIVF